MTLKHFNEENLRDVVGDGPEEEILMNTILVLQQIIDKVTQDMIAIRGDESLDQKTKDSKLVNLHDKVAAALILQQTAVFKHIEGLEFDRKTEKVAEFQSKSQNLINTIRSNFEINKKATNSHLTFLQKVLRVFGIGSNLSKEIKAVAREEKNSEPVIEYKSSLPADYYDRYNSKQQEHQHTLGEGAREVASHGAEHVKKDKNNSSEPKDTLEHKIRNN